MKRDEQQTGVARGRATVIDRDALERGELPDPDHLAERSRPGGQMSTTAPSPEQRLIDAVALQEQRRRGIEDQLRRRGQETLLTPPDAREALPTTDPAGPPAA